MRRFFIDCAFLALPVLLAACSEDFYNSGLMEDVPETDIVVTTFDDLPVHSLAVTSTESSSSVNKKKSSSSFSEKESSSNSECNPDSSVQDSSSNCSGCNPDSTVEGSSSSSSGSSPDSSTHDSLQVLEYDFISGYAQKGPFASGTITLYELDDKTFARTGNIFTGKIASKNGDFRIDSVTLKSPYALLEAKGLYYNEVTGKQSNDTITLNALIDFSNRKNANVNLLTHLEYKRVLYLMKSGIEMSAAKKQAQTEIFNVFNIQGEFAASEDFDLLKPSDGTRELFVLNVLMLHNLNDTDFAKLLTQFANDIEKDGKWDDEVTKAKIADWARFASLTSGKITNIRIMWQKAFGSTMSYSVENRINNFWYVIYGLGDCNFEKNGVMEPVKNEYSSDYGSDVRFICSISYWREASETDKDTYGWEAGEDGELRRGDFYKTAMYKYVGSRSSGLWKPATHNDTTLGLKGCTYNRLGEVGKGVDGFYYVCAPQTVGWDWIKADDGVVADLNGELCTAENVGKVIKGAVTSTNRYYCAANGWIDLMGENSWSLNVPKEARLNPDIAYDSIVDSRDGFVYKTVKIGNQVWMAENLNYRGSNGWRAGNFYDWLSAIDSAALANDPDNPQRCSSDRTCSIPDTVQGRCPDGWHLPTKEEWETLFDAVGGQSTAGKILRSQSGWEGDSANGTDDFGFSALPAGFEEFYYEIVDIDELPYGNYEHQFKGEHACFFTSTEDSRFSAYIVLIMNTHDNAIFSGRTKKDRCSVRCVKN